MAKVSWAAIWWSVFREALESHVGAVSAGLRLEHFEAGLSFTLPKAADSDECCELLLSRPGLALLPVVNRNLVNADKDRVVGGRDSG